MCRRTCWWCDVEESSWDLPATLRANLHPQDAGRDVLDADIEWRHIGAKLRERGCCAAQAASLRRPCDSRCLHDQPQHESHGVRCKEAHQAYCPWRPCLANGKGRRLQHRVPSMQNCYEQLVAQIKSCLERDVYDTLLAGDSGLA